MARRRGSFAPGTGALAGPHLYLQEAPNTVKTSPMPEQFAARSPIGEQYPKPPLTPWSGDGGGGLPRLRERGGESRTPWRQGRAPSLVHASRRARRDPSHPPRPCILQTISRSPARPSADDWFGDHAVVGCGDPEPVGASLSHDSRATRAFPFNETGRAGGAPWRRSCDAAPRSRGARKSREAVAGLAGGRRADTGGGGVQTRSQRSRNKHARHVGPDLSSES